MGHDDRGTVEGNGEAIEKPGALFPMTIADFRKKGSLRSLLEGHRPAKSCGVTLGQGFFLGRPAPAPQAGI